MKNTNNKVIFSIIGAIFIGIIVGLILASNMEWTDNIVASQGQAKKVVLGSNKAPLESRIQKSKISLQVQCEDRILCGLSQCPIFFLTFDKRPFRSCPHIDLPLQLKVVILQGLFVDQ